MPATNAVPDRAEDAIMKPPCKKLYGSAAVLALANGMYFCVSSLGFGTSPGAREAVYFNLQSTLKSCRFQKWFATNCPAAMVADSG